MAYKPQGFYTGQTVQLEHLEKIEQGIMEAMPLIVTVKVNDTVTPETFSSDTPFEDITKAIRDGRLVIVKMAQLVGNVFLYPWRVSISGSFVEFVCPYLINDNGNIRSAFTLKVKSSGWTMNDASPFN